MEQQIALRVLTPEGPAIDDEAVSVIASGETGQIGFLRNHAPLVTTLKPGKLSWRDTAGPWKVAHLGAGILEITHNRLTILTDFVSTEPVSSAAHA